MTIALDLDGTWTRDPATFRRVLETFRASGHEVVMVTGRKAWTPDMLRHQIPESLQIIYAGHEPKERVTLRQGIRVDVWIDDMPAMIQECAVIQPSPDKEL